jgi:hypothetical protein
VYHKKIRIGETEGGFRSANHEKDSDDKSLMLVNGVMTEMHTDCEQRNGDSVHYEDTCEWMRKISCKAKEREREHKGRGREGEKEIPDTHHSSSCCHFAMMIFHENEIFPNSEKFVC